MGNRWINIIEVREIYKTDDTKHIKFIMERETYVTQTKN